MVGSITAPFFGKTISSRPNRLVMETPPSTASKAGISCQRLAGPQPSNIGMEHHPAPLSTNAVILSVKL